MQDFPISSSASGSRHVRGRDVVFLLLLAFVALLTHGFHPGAEDAEVYLPNVKQALNPALYPIGAEFFRPYARLSLLPHLMVWSIRLTHLSYDWAIFLWHVATIFLFLYACRRIMATLFDSEAGRWAGVVAVTGLLTLPVAGTALFIMDQYVTARSVVTPAVMFLVLYVLERNWMRAGAWLVFSALVHPLMAVFGASYAVALWWAQRRLKPRGSTVAAMAAVFAPLGISFGQSSQAYRNALASRPYFLLQHWEWYELVGAVAPMFLFLGFWWLAKQRGMAAMRDTSLAAAVYGFIYLAGAVVFTVPAPFASLAKLQPMRFLHLLYILLVLMGFGLIGHYLLRKRALLWLALFLPLFGGMWYASRQVFPATRQVEWPGTDSHNRYVQAYLWIRQNTPADAVIALDPRHMALPGADQQGFQVIAERSMLVDSVKDSGIAAMFPELAEAWLRQYSAQMPWERLGREDFLRLKRDYGVSWVVLHVPDSKGLPCSYRNEMVMVCRVE
jgi:hypothetical protein